MEYKRIAPVSQRRITLDEAKAQLNILTTSQDAYIESLIAVAEETIMARTNTSLTVSRYEGLEYSFCGVFLPLPVYPVAEKSSGTEGIQSIAVVVEQGDAEVVLVEGTDWVYKSNGIQFIGEDTSFFSVRVNFFAGFGTDDFPQGLKGATLMFIGTLFANRQSEMGNVVEKIPYGIEFMINAHSYNYFK